MITQSRIISDSPQKDGRRYVVELHVDEDGSEELVTYLAEKGADVAALLPIRSAQIEERREAERNAPPPPRTFTADEVKAVFVEEQKKGSVDAEKLAAALKAVKPTDVLDVAVVADEVAVEVQP